MYWGKDCVFIIDGMNAIDACFYFAGVLGIDPRKKTLNVLWRMAEGRVKQRRKESLELAYLVWGAGSIDWEEWVRFGHLTETGSGGQVQLDPEIQQRVDERVEQMRKDDQTLPKFVPDEMRH